jgi:hypothetical protein
MSRADTTTRLVHRKAVSRGESSLPPRRQRAIERQRRMQDGKALPSRIHRHDDARQRVNIE